MNKNMTAWFIVLLLSCLSINYLKAQISQGGTPPSFKEVSNLKSALVGVLVPPPDINQVQQQDKVNDSLGKPYRFAMMIPADYCMDDTGKWDTLSTGEIIWRLKITSPGASGIQIIYDNFKLPKGGKLFLYNEDKTFVIGAFTEQNNHSSRVFATEVIPGESCTLEYVKSTESSERPSLCISQVGYVYRGMGNIFPGTNQLKASGTCEVNVRCSPEGDNWTDVKRSSVRILMSGYLCSGTLLNNTAQDFKNLLSTAFHCVTGIESHSLTWVFYFNYENVSCNRSSFLSVGGTMTGADIRAEIPINGGSDAVLLELTDTIPKSYNTYWAGWDNRDTVVAGGVSIHHPAGDGAKISTSRSFWRTETWNGSDSTVGAKNAHWSVIFASTTNGFGTTEGGSSGSGIFGPDEHFRGQLSGGSSSCTVPSGDNLYGKLSYSWNSYGPASNVQFKSWLDPLNSGINRLNGIDYNAQKGVYWTSSPPVTYIDSTVQYTDNSIFNPTSWNWVFEGGTPATSSIQNPVVTYASAGLYNVSLTVTNDKGSNIKTRTDYVYVKPKPVWKEQNTRFPAPARGIEGISVVDSLHVWAWAYDGSDPTNSILEYTRTTDGGNNWKADSIVNPSLKGFGMANLYAISSDTAYAAVYGPDGGGNILQTLDGGMNWQIQATANFTAPNGFPDVVYFFDRSNGVCIGDPNGGFFEIYHTSNGGTTWTRVSSSSIPANLKNETGITNYYDAKGDTIWFGTSNGRVYRSINKGISWTASATGLAGIINVKFRDSKVGFAIQSSDTANAFALRKTTNGGTTWSAYTLPSNLQEGSLEYVPASNSSWINVSSLPPGSAFSSDDGNSYVVLDGDNQYTSVGFYNEYIGWAGGFNLDSIHGGIYKWDRTSGLLTAVNNIVTGGNANSSVLFTIQPNPARDFIKIISNGDISGDVKVSFINSNGMLLDHYTFKNNQGIFSRTMGLGNLSNGMYFVVLQAGTKVETQKIIVQ